MSPTLLRECTGTVISQAGPTGQLLHGVPSMNPERNKLLSDLRDGYTHKVYLGNEWTHE